VSPPPVGAPFGLQQARAVYGPAAALGEQGQQARIPIREFSVFSFVEEVACAPLSREYAGQFAAVQHGDAEHVCKMAAPCI